jgi:hypothetical protein
VEAYAWRFAKYEVTMEVAELKGAISDLEARMAKIRDWL